MSHIPLPDLNTLVGLSDAAAALWVRAARWSNERLTIGTIPREVATTLAGYSVELRHERETAPTPEAAAARELIDVGLWDELVGDDYQFVDWPGAGPYSPLEAVRQTYDPAR